MRSTSVRACSHVYINGISLEFESRKDVVHIFNNLLRRQIGSRWPTVEYLCKKPEVLFDTLRGYENEDIALNTGMIMKEMLRHEPLCKILLWSDQCVSSYSIFTTLIGHRFYTFPRYIEERTFGISCDAFANYKVWIQNKLLWIFFAEIAKETLTRHKPMVAEYLEKNYDRVSEAE